MVDTINQPIEANSIPVQPPIEVGPPGIQPGVDTSAARAFMFQNGLSNVLGGRNADDFNLEISQGREDYLRREAAAGIDANALEMRRQTIRALSQSGREFDDELIKRIGQPPLHTDPSSVLEKAWAKKYVDTANSMVTEDSAYDQARKELPRPVASINNQASEHIARMSGILKWEQNARDAYDRQSYAGAGADYLKRWFPGYDQYKERGWGTDFAYPIMFGANKREQFQHLMHLPMDGPDGFNAQLETIGNKLINDNPQLAMQFFRDMYGYSAGDETIDNLFMGLDVASIIPGAAVGKLARLAGLLGESAEVSKNMIRGLRWGTHEPETWDALDAPWDIGKPEGTAQWYKITSEERAAQAVGNNTEAGAKIFTRQLNEEKKTGTPDSPGAMIESLTSANATDVKGWTANIGRGGVELANRMWERFNVYNDKLVDLIKMVGRVETLPELDETVARTLVPELKQWYKGLSDGIYDVSYAGLNPETNAYQFDLHIGASNGNPFNTWAQAKGVANKIGGKIPEGPVRQGMGWKVIKRVDLPEDTKLSAGLRAITKEGKLQNTIWDGWLGGINRFRTPKEILSINENTQREIATHHPQVLLGLAKEALRDVEKLPKGLPFTSTRKKWEQWRQTLDYAKTRWKETGGKESWFKDGAEMDDFYLRNYDRAPSEQEKLAYLAVMRNVETNRIWTTMREYSNKSKWGAQEYQLYFFDQANQKKLSGFFDARIIPELPLDLPAGVYIQTGKGPGKVRGVRIDIKTQGRIKKGELKVLQIYNTQLLPLEKFIKDDSLIHYIITDKFDTQALSWDKQVPRQGGGHFVYDYDHYIKQAKIKTGTRLGRTYNWYMGDTTLLPISIRASGQEIVRHLNAVRELLRDGKEAEAKAYHDSVNWDLTWEEHKGWYQEQKGAEYKPARLSLHEPLVLTDKDKGVIDMDKSLENRYGDTFRDTAKYGNPARQNMVDFTGERDAMDLMTLRDEGTVHNPLWKYEPARFVDAIGVMNRSYAKAVKSLFMDDMKNYSMRHWLTQAKDYLNVDINTLMHSPQWYFNNADTFWKSGAKNTPEVTKLRAAKFQIQQFQGVPSKLDTAIHMVQQGMVNMLYGKFGAKAIPNWMLTQVRDPAAYLRSMVVHMKLGMFNIPAFFVQASTFVNVMGIAGPSHAAPGAFGSFIHNWARLNKHPEILDRLDKMATYFGYRPGEFTEASQELSRRGFGAVGHTHAFEDALYQNKIIRGKWGRVLDAGQTFFREGAEGIRRAAWFTAYHEYRRGASWTEGAHATGALTKREWDRILSRASDLDHNMSRAANSQLQSGLASFPMQFQAYHLRLLELATGKRLTAAEKGRLFLTTSIMYGLPLGGMGLLPIPYLGDYISDSARKNGYYVPGEKWYSDVLMRGLPDAVMKQITNTNWNIAERWGTGKFDMLDTFGDESFWQTISGAAGSTLINTVKNVSPFIKAGLAAITGHYEDFPFTANDVLDPLVNEISTGSNIRGFLRTVNTGYLFSKNGTALTDVDQAKWSTAILRYGVGLTPQPTFDLHKVFEWDQADKANYKEAERNSSVEWHRAFQALEDNDPDQARKSFQRGFFELDRAGVPQPMRLRFWTQAIRSYKNPLVDKTEGQWAIGRNIPSNEAETRRDIFERTQKARGQ